MMLVRIEYCNAHTRTHLRPDSLGQLAQVLRRGLWLVDVKRVAVHLRMRWMWPGMVRRDARSGRGLLVARH